MKQLKIKLEIFFFFLLVQDYSSRSNNFAALC